MLELLSYYRKKELGSFYTPKLLAEYLANKMVSLVEKRREALLSVLDPAVGDGILLKIVSEKIREKGMSAQCYGVDVVSEAIDNTTRLFAERDELSAFVTTDALYPLGCESPDEGWQQLKRAYGISDFQLIISNPPWGANMASYQHLTKDFRLASGQFDIYDLFVETIINNLADGGVYGIILPDSIYRQEHQKTRKMLLRETSICYIIRLGEQFFPQVNNSVSMIIGKKVKPSAVHQTCCVHLSHEDRRRVLLGYDTMEVAEQHSGHWVRQQAMIAEGHEFTLDVDNPNEDLYERLYRMPRLKSYVTIRRGVELSKKGKVVMCPHCKKWFPAPKKSEQGEAVCPSCMHGYALDEAVQRTVINEYNQSNNSRPIIVGEDISRYAIHTRHYILTGLDGIDYKPEEWYAGSKILIRKTGVGITAAIDYRESLANQVVYLCKVLPLSAPVITNEAVLAVINSRVVTYFIIKKYGSTSWQSHPYLTQSMVGNLPFPDVDLECGETIEALRKLTAMVKENSDSANDFPIEADMAIERIVGKLFCLSESDYQLIFKALSEVEQLIPFKRLRLFTVQEMFSYGV